MKTYHPDAGSIERNWHVIDADGQVLGRLASRAASILRGKHKPCFAPNLDAGDYVVVINAGKIAVTGSKMEDKKYFSHSGYPGGARNVSLADMLEKTPEKVIEHAVKGMLPGNRLGRKMLQKLKVYRGESHPHAAQKPVKING